MDEILEFSTIIMMLPTHQKYKSYGHVMEIIIDWIGDMMLETTWTFGDYGTATRYGTSTIQTPKITKEVRYHRTNRTPEHTRDSCRTPGLPD